MAPAFIEEGPLDDLSMERKVQDLITWRDGHDRRCEERQTEVVKKIDGLGRLVIGMVIALLAWSMVEVYRLQTSRAPQPIQQAAPPTIIYAPPGAAPVVVNPVQGQSQPQLPAPP